MIWEQAEIVRLLKGQPGTQYQEADEANRHIIRDWIRGLLRTSVVTVEFVKSDGTVREMKCTLNEDFIPQANIPKGPAIPVITGAVAEKKKSKNLQEDLAPKEETAIKVYDTEVGAWRSFRYDRLQKISATLDFNK
jgi:hypothetical protein